MVALVDQASFVLQYLHEETGWQLSELHTLISRLVFHLVVVLMLCLVCKIACWFLPFLRLLLVNLWSNVCVLIVLRVHLRSLVLRIDGVLMAQNLLNLICVDLVLQLEYYVLKEFDNIYPLVLIYRFNFTTDLLLRWDNILYIS